MLSDLMTQYRNSYRWCYDDGINLPMLLDTKRNRFYDRILQENVKDRCCVEIGFGTGILSILALKHGAKHVLAFESDYRRFLLGQKIIKQLNLQHSIDLVHEKFHKNMTERVGTRLVFHEIVNPTIWGEGLYHCMNTQYHMIPDEYSFKIVASIDRECFIEREAEVVASLNEVYDDIKDPSWPLLSSLPDLKKLPQHIQREIYSVYKMPTWLPYFNLDCSFNLDPGVEINQEWQVMIRDLYASNFESNQGFWDTLPLSCQQFDKLMPKSICLGHVIVSAKTMTAAISISESQPQLVDISQNSHLRVVLPKTALPEKDCVLFMIPKIRHGTHQLNLITEESGDHWGGPVTCLIANVTTDVEIAIDLSTGQHRISPV